jgi:hypothetical protein
MISLSENILVASVDRIILQHIYKYAILWCRFIILFDSLSLKCLYVWWCLTPLSTNFLRWIIYHSLKLSYIENPIWPFTFLRTKPKVKVVNWGGVGLRFSRISCVILHWKISRLLPMTLALSVRHWWCCICVHVFKCTFIPPCVYSGQILFTRDYCI